MRSQSNTLLSAVIGSVVATVILCGCSGPVHPEVTAGLDACAECNMVIDEVNQACGHVADGEFVPFDSPGCLLRSHDEMRRRGTPVPTEVYLALYTTGEFVPADRAVLLLTQHRPTVMGAGVLCFGSSADAEDHRSAADEVVTDWKGYRRRSGQPDTVVEAVVTATSLEPEILEVEKGDLVLFKLSGDELEDAVSLEIRGYPEIGEIIVAPTQEPTEVRFFATRPGAGFPVIGSDEQALGMIRVTGAHTADEAAQ